jgi:hypothetical protein
VETLVALAIKAGLLLMAIGVIGGCIALVRRLLPKQHPVRRRVAAFVESGQLVESGRLLLAVALVVAGAVVTYVYS